MAMSIYKINYQAKLELHRKIRFTIFFILGILILCSLFNSYICFGCRIANSSMEPTLQDGNLAFVSSFAVPNNKLYFHKNPIKRGDVVCVKPIRDKNLNIFFRAVDKFVAFFTFQQIAPIADSKNMSESKLIRRVIALPGDTVYVKDYVAYVKTPDSDYFLTEFELSKDEYDISVDKDIVDANPKINFFKDCKEIKLDENEYFVLSDNRKSSIDSKLFGPIKANQIRGKVLLKYFPLTQMKIL